MDVFGHVRAVILERATQALPQTDLRRPSDPFAEARRITIETADVDALLLRWPLHVMNAAGPRSPDQQRCQVPVADRLAASDIEHFTVARVGCSGPQKRIRGVVHIDEIAHL